MASDRPAKMPAQRVCAPALVATPVRDREPPTGSAWNHPTGQVGETLRQEVARGVWSAAVRVGHRRGDAGCLGQRHERDRDGSDEELGGDRDVGQGNAREPTRNGRDVAHALDRDACQGGGDRDDHQRDQGRQGLEPFDLMGDGPHDDGGHGHKGGRHVPLADVERPFKQLAQRVAAGRFVASRIAEHADDDLQGNTRGEAGHDRVGHEAHQ